jgi:6-phosphogluconolactonase
MQPEIDIVSGEDKALALKAVLEGPHDPDQLPAQLIQPSRGRLLWCIDRPAVRLVQS